METKKRIKSNLINTITVVAMLLILGFVSTLLGFEDTIKNLLICFLVLIILSLLDLIATFTIKKNDTYELISSCIVSSKIFNVIFLSILMVTYYFDDKAVLDIEFITLFIFSILWGLLDLFFEYLDAKIIGKKV